MPGKVKKVNGHQVIWGGKVTAKKTSKVKAQAQLNLLRGIEHGFVPTGKPARYKLKKKYKGKYPKDVL